MPNNKMRVDKWLWCVRLFKSRTKATDACKKGHIKIGELRLKPSSLIGPEDVIELRKEGFNLIFKINALLPRRVSAVLAAPCYDNLTSEEELNKYRDWFVGKAPPERREPGQGRPTKRERRDLDHFKDEIFLDGLFEDSGK